MGRARFGAALRATRSPTATAGRPGASSAPRWTPPRRSRSATSGGATRGSVGGGARPVARVRLVARRGAAVPQRVVDRGRGRGAVGGDEQLDGVHARRRGSRPPRASRARSARRGRSARRARRRTRARRRCAARAARGCRRTASARRGRRPGARPCRCRSAAASWARLKNGTARAVVGRDVAPGRQRAPAARRARPRSRRPRARARGTSRRARSRTCAPSSRSARREQRHQLVPGVLARTRRRPSAASTRGELRPRVHGPRARSAGLDGAEARQARRLAQRGEPARAEVDRVELER